MSGATVVLNIAYVLMVLSPLTRQMLRLRVLVVASSAAFVGYGLLSGTWSMVAWNTLFGTFHLWHVYRLILERRRLQLTEFEADVREQVFPAMGVSDFVHFWEMGREAVMDGRLTEQGRRQAELLLILSGTAEVRVDGRCQREVGPLELVGEMSLVTGDVASATVTSHGEVTVRRWDHEALVGLERVRPSAAAGLNRSFSAKLAGRVKEAERSIS